MGVKLYCREFGCSELLDPPGGYCDEHRKRRHRRYDRTRASSKERGYDARWRKIRKAKLNRDPLCEDPERVHEQVKEAVPADTVHHIDGNPRNNRPENLMSVCVACHNLVHARGAVAAQEVA